MSQKWSALVSSSSTSSSTGAFGMEALEGRTLLSLVGGVDPFSMGKGDFIWKVASAEQNTGTTTVAKLIDYMKARGFKWLVVKAGDGNSGPGSGLYAQFNKSLVDTVHAAGLKIFAYHFVYGGKTPNSRGATTTIDGEKAVRDAIMALNPDGLIIDAESDFENATNNAATAEDYAKIFKQKYPTKLLGLDTFAYARFHTKIPYLSYLKYADVAMPQLFWKTLTIANTPEQILSDVDVDWKALYADFAGKGHPEAARPIVPIGQGYDVSASNPTPPDDITRFFNLLRSDADPASPFGYNGVSFWSAQQHTAAQWTAISNGTLSAPTGSISGNVFNDQNADGVKENNDPGLSARLVYDDTNNNARHDANEGSVKTDAGGNYTLPYMGVRTHRVHQELPAGWRQSTPAGGAAQTITLTTAGQKFTGVNFGATQLARITGTVFDDRDANGLRGAVEPLMSGWTVFADADGDGVLDASEARGVTDSHGNFVIDLPAGSYHLRQVVQSGWRVTNPAAGFYDLSVANAEAVSRTFGDTVLTVISGYVFNDKNGDGIKQTGENGLSGWRVFVDLDGDRIWDGNEASVLTDSSGKYRFNTLAAGTYRITVLQQSAWRATVPTPPVRKITIASGGTTSNKNFGEAQIV